MPKPKQRTALEALEKKRLAQLVHEFGLDIATSRPKSELIDAIASAKAVSFPAVLAQLNRSELKDICRAHGLDDSGKEKDLRRRRATRSAETAWRYQYGSFPRLG